MQFSLPVGTFTASLLNSANKVVLIAAGSGQFILTFIKMINKKSFIYRIYPYG